MKNYLRLLPLILISFTFSSCDDENENNDIDGPVLIDTPDTYSFDRNGASTVSFSGQTTRLQQSD